MKIGFPPARESNFELLRGYFFETLHFGDPEFPRPLFGDLFGTSWVSLGDPFTCGVKARKPYVPGTRKEPIKYMAIDELRADDGNTDIYFDKPKS